MAIQQFGVEADIGLVWCLCLPIRFEVVVLECVCDVGVWIVRFRVNAECILPGCHYIECRLYVSDEALRAQSVASLLMSWV